MDEELRAIYENEIRQDLARRRREDRITEFWRSALARATLKHPKKNSRLELRDTVAILDGTPHPITIDQEAILRKLVDASGLWVSSTQLKTSKNSGERPDRIIARMPPAIRSVITSQRGAGFRITLD